MFFYTVCVRPRFHVPSFLTCDNTGNFGHEAFDSPDGYALRLVLDARDDVLDLQREEDRVRSGRKPRPIERDALRVLGAIKYRCVDQATELELPLNCSLFQSREDYFHLVEGRRDGLLPLNLHTRR